MCFFNKGKTDVSLRKLNLEYTDKYQQRKIRKIKPFVILLASCYG